MAEEQVNLARNALARMGFDEDQSIFLTDNQGLGTLSSHACLTDEDVDKAIVRDSHVEGTEEIRMTGRPNTSANRTHNEDQSQSL